MVEIYSKDGKFFKNKACTSEFSDQETAAILWKLNQTFENADKYRLPRIGAKPVKFLLAIIIIVSLAFVVSSALHWWPDLFARFVHAPPLEPPTTSPQQAEQAMTEAVKNYSERISDLEKLVSLLLALSAFYTVALGLSSWASVQANLQQAEKWIQAQQAIMKETREQSQIAVEKLEELLVQHQSGVSKIESKIEDEITYARRITGASASLALALVGPSYTDDARTAIKLLSELKSKYGTDRNTNIYLGRLNKALKQYATAAEAMSDFIRQKEAANAGHDDDTVDAYYNRACYNSLFWLASAPNRGELQVKILSDLQRCTLLNPSLKADIRGDSDFDPVRTETWFAPFR